MKRTRARWIVPVAALLVVATADGALAQDQGTGKKVGEKVDDAVKDLKGGLRKAGDRARDEFSRARTSVENMSVESRVYGRLHWDKALNDAAIDLTASEQGVITLTGQVADGKAKLRAVELTRETVGVTKVVDQLSIKPAPVATPASNP